MLTHTDLYRPISLDRTGEPQELAHVFPSGPPKGGHYRKAAQSSSLSRDPPSPAQFRPGVPAQTGARETADAERRVLLHSRSDSRAGSDPDRASLRRSETDARVRVRARLPSASPGSRAPMRSSHRQPRHSDTAAAA